VRLGVQFFTSSLRLGARSVKVKPSTVLGRRFVKHFLGFGVGVGVGLSPFLGKWHIPGFSGLLELFPDDVQQVAIPLSSFLMGCVAAATQFSATEKTRHKTLLLYFKYALAGVLSLSFGLVFFYMSHVVTISVQGGEAKTSIVIGGARLKTCGCAESASDEQCIRELSLAPGAAESCWGSLQIRRNKAVLVMLYVANATCFAALIGIMIIKMAVGKSAVRQRAQPVKGERLRPKWKARRNGEDSVPTQPT
jgi:hypothetical protein